MQQAANKLYAASLLYSFFIYQNKHIAFLNRTLVLFLTFIYNIIYNLLFYFLYSCNQYQHLNFTV